MSDNTEIINRGLVAVWVDRLLGKNWQHKLVGHIVVVVGTLTAMQATGFVFPTWIDHSLKSLTAFAVAYSCYAHRLPEKPSSTP